MRPSLRKKRERDPVSKQTTVKTSLKSGLEGSGGVKAAALTTGTFKAERSQIKEPL